MLHLMAVVASVSKNRNSNEYQAIYPGGLEVVGVLIPEEIQAEAVLRLATGKQKLFPA